MSCEGLMLGAGWLEFRAAVGDPFALFGHSPTVAITAENNTLDHYNTDHGTKTKDCTAVLDSTYKMSVTTDRISPDNMARFFLGTTAKITTAAAAGQTYDLPALVLGPSYSIGESPSTPMGVSGLDTTVPVTVALTGGGGALVEGTDFVVDYPNGSITFLTTGAATVGGLYTVTYDLAASEHWQTITSGKLISGSMRFVSDNAQGQDGLYLFDSVSITPSGDFALKGEDWATMQFDIELLKPLNGAEIMHKSQPVIL